MHKKVISVVLENNSLAAPSISSSISLGSTLSPNNVILNFENASGIDAHQIYVSIHGVNERNVEGYYDLSHEPAVFLDVGTAVREQKKYITLDTLLKRGPSTIQDLHAGRVTLGLQKGADFNEQFTDPAQKNADATIFDKFELTIDKNGTNINLTQVDFFGFPLKITSGQEVRGFNDGMTRKQIFDDYAATQSGGWEKLLLKTLPDQPGGPSRRLRILNPGKIAPGNAGYFKELYAYWDALINEYWATGKKVTLIKDTPGHQEISGIANGKTIDFGALGKYDRPKTVDLFGEAVYSGSSADIVKWLAGAINRGVIRNPNIADQGDTGKYYANSLKYNNGLYNRYAEFLHRSLYSVNGQAYALAYDDVFGYSSDMAVKPNASVTVKIQPFGEPL